MRQGSIAFAAIVALGACHGPANLTPDTPGPPLRVTWERASGAWWADLALAEPAVPVLVQRLPTGLWRYLAMMSATEGTPLAAGRHQVRVPVWACPRQAVLWQAGTERLELTYAEVAPIRSEATTDVARPMTPHTVVTAETYGTAGLATGLSCDDGTLPESPEVVAGLFPDKTAADAFRQTLNIIGPSTEALRQQIQASGGRVLATQPER